MAEPNDFSSSALRYSSIHGSQSRTAAAGVVSTLAAVAAAAEPAATSARVAIAWCVDDECPGALRRNDTNSTPWDTREALTGGASAAGTGSVAEPAEVGTRAATALPTRATITVPTLINFVKMCESDVAH